MVCSRKKMSFVFLLLVLLCARAFAYDGSIIACINLGSYSRYEFINSIGTNSFSDELYSSFNEQLKQSNARTDRFFLIDENSVDEEDVDVINGIPSYLTSNYSVRDGSTFSTGVLRNANSSGIDGWIVVSNYTSARGWFHYLYYFHAVSN